MKKKTIRQSKRLIISLFVTFFCLTASAAQAQTALVTIDLQQVKMVQVMDEIENQTKYLFIYDKNILTIDFTIDKNYDIILNNQFKN